MIFFEKNDSRLALANCKNRKLPENEKARHQSRA